MSFIGKLTDPAYPVGRVLLWDAARKKEQKKKHPAVPGRVPRIRKNLGGNWLSYLPRCQMSASYSAMVRSLLNMPALAMLIRHLRRQPSGSQA